MDLPALLPNKLRFAATAENDRALMMQLIKKPEDLVTFFESACIDETWSQAHSEFMKNALEEMTKRFFQDKLSFELARRIVIVIRKHYPILKPIIPLDLTIKYRNSATSLPIQVNSLLWGASSEYLHTMIRQECRDVHLAELQLETVSEVIFSQINEYMNTGKIENLWKKTKSEIEAVLYQAKEWEMTDLMVFCEEILAHYITPGNVIETFIQSYENRFNHLKVKCIELINTLDFGFRIDSQVDSQVESQIDSKVESQIDSQGSNDVVFEFRDFRSESLEVFELLHHLITKLVCGGKLTAESSFSDVVNRCPHLVCLDISQTDDFTNRLLDIPGSLEELDLSNCEWINHKTLKSMIEICPNLTKISFVNDRQLKYSDWPLLRELKNLRRIDISGCRQIDAESFVMILQACPGLVQLSMSNCGELLDNSFFEIGRFARGVVELDVSRTNISDAALIDISAKCSSLQVINVSRCENLTDKGILQVVHNLPNLQKLKIAKCRFSKEVIKELGQM